MNITLRLLPFVSDSLAIGQIVNDDTRVVLFVKPAAGITWDQRYTDQVKARIRAELTPRHVPAVILTVMEIPYTRSGKKVEMAVTQIIHGDPVPNRDALANPEALAEYESCRAVLLEG